MRLDDVTLSSIKKGNTDECFIQINTTKHDVFFVDEDLVQVMEYYR